MNFFRIRAGAGLSVNGSLILQQIKSRGGEAIEAADGYYVRTDLSADELREVVSTGSEAELEVQAIDPSSVSKEGMVPALAQFLGLDLSQAA